MSVVILTGHTLTLEQVKRVLYQKEAVVLSKDSIDVVKKSRKAVEDIVANKKIVYGITTGFGKFSDVFIEADDVEELQWNLIHSHACGVGEPFPEIV